MKKQKNRYRSICPIANALEIVGDRWTLLVMRDMMFFGRHEYHEFLQSAEGISTNILAERLSRLMRARLIEVVPHPKNKTRKFYYLTKKGKDFMPTMIEMSLWGGQHLEASKLARAKVNQVKRNPRLFMEKMMEEMKRWEQNHGIKV